MSAAMMWCAQSEYLRDGWTGCPAPASRLGRGCCDCDHYMWRDRPVSLCRDMVVLLKGTYPAALLSDLRHFSIAALYDVVGAFPERFVATTPPNVPQENLRRFISNVEALVTISRNNVAAGAEDLFSRTPLPVTPSTGLSMPSLPSLQPSPRTLRRSPLWLTIGRV